MARSYGRKTTRRAPARKSYSKRGSYSGRYASSNSYRSGVQRKRSKSRSAGREVRIVIQQVGPSTGITGPAFDPRSGNFVAPAQPPKRARF